MITYISYYLITRSMLILGLRWWKARTERSWSKDLGWYDLENKERLLKNDMLHIACVGLIPFVGDAAMGVIGILGAVVLFYYVAGRLLGYRFRDL